MRNLSWHISRFTCLECNCITLLLFSNRSSCLTCPLSQTSFYEISVWNGSTFFWGFWSTNAITKFVGVMSDWQFCCVCHDKGRIYLYFQGLKYVDFWPKILEVKCSTNNFDGRELWRQQIWSSLFKNLLSWMWKTLYEHRSCSIEWC